MSIKISKEAYEKLIKKDLDFLNEHCPDSLELDHIKLIVCSSLDWHYPDKNTCTALKRIENRLKVELKSQKVEFTEQPKAGTFGKWITKDGFTCYTDNRATAVRWYKKHLWNKENKLA